MTNRLHRDAPLMNRLGATLLPDLTTTGDFYAASPTRTCTP
jgi:hypothetical protein